MLREKKRVPSIFNGESNESFICVNLCSPTPPTIRSHTSDYATRMMVNVSRIFEMCHVIHDIHISSGQSPRYDVTVRCGSREAMSEIPRSYGNKSG
jgi:hypothetical protein